MALVNKQDSNTTGLRYAVEVSPGVVDGSAVWTALEPNSYKGFGGDVKTKARKPINASRQNKKGVVVDLDASAGFEQDLTQDNFQDLSQCFFFAALRKKSEVAIATVDGTANAYNPASGGTDYWAGDLLFAKRADSAANNGLKKVTGVPSATVIPVTDTGLLDATLQSAVISRVGFEFGAGQVTVDVSGSFPKLHLAGQATATGTLTGTGVNVSNSDTVTIGTRVYTFQTVLTNVDGNVKIGATAALSLTNLFRAINASGGVPGTDYALATTAHPRVTATNPTGTTVVLTAKASGAVGNSVVTTETSTQLSFGAGTLTGGTGGRGWDSFGLIPGELVHVGDDAAATRFFNATNKGFCRVRSITAADLELDKTQFVMVTDDGTDTGAGGTGQTIRVFFGRVIRNEPDPALIVTRGIQLERTLGAPDSALPTQIQAEYLTRSLANTWKLDTKTADIVSYDMGFLSNTNEVRTGAQGVKAGTRPSLPDTEAFNATSDVSFTKLALVKTNDSCPTPLFSFFTDLQFEIKNNIKQNKAVSVLGAFDSTPGFFDVSATLQAYFTTVDEIQAVKDNSSVTVETHFVKANQGISIDIPLVTLSKAMADVKINEPIMMPLDCDAATGKSINVNYDYTMLVVFWDYLPTFAG